MSSSSQPGDARLPDAQARLRSALAGALLRRDTITISALRSALSAISSAEAVAVPPEAAPGASAHIAGAVAGLGAGETRRRSLSRAEIGRIIRTEISERLAAARDVEDRGHPDRAERLRGEASALAAAAGDAVPDDDPAADSGDAAERARQRDLVRRGYDAISMAYRGDDGGGADPSAEDVRRYAGWAAELAGLLPGGARIVDLGCGAGIPATRELAGHGLRVLGVDFSAVQIRRAHQLVPAARFVQADMTSFCLRPASVDAVVSFYALIHVPLGDQQALFPRVREWIRPGGYFLAVVGARRWTGTERYLGADMFWDHADTGTYLRWLPAARLMPVWDRFIPEGDGGHTLVLAQAR